MADPVQLKTLTDGTAHYSFRTNLDGVDYLFELDWSQREQRWYLTLRTVTGALLAGRTKVVSNWPMWRYYHHREGMPAGELMALNTTNDDSPPGLFELGIGARCTLTYLPVGSLS